MPSLSLISLVRTDLRHKAQWCYDSDRPAAPLKVLLTDGTAAMLLYRLMQWSRCWRLVPLEMIFNKLNAVGCNCIIGRGADFGPGFVLIHATGVVINGEVKGGENVYLEHQVTIGAERRQAPGSAATCLSAPGRRSLARSRLAMALAWAPTPLLSKTFPHSTVVGIPAKPVAWLATGQRAGGTDETPTTPTDRQTPTPRYNSPCAIESASRNKPREQSNAHKRTSPQGPARRAQSNPWRFTDPLCERGKRRSSASSCGAELADHRRPRKRRLTSIRGSLGQPSTRVDREEHGSAPSNSRPRRSRSRAVGNRGRRRSLDWRVRINHDLAASRVQGFWVPSTFSPSTATFPKELEPIQDLTLEPDPCPRASRPRSEILSMFSRLLQFRRLGLNFPPPPRLRRSWSARG